MKALMVRTDFSLGESALKAENAVRIARDAGYTAVISADSMNIASVIPLQRAAGDDMAVICGVKLNVVDDPDIRAPRPPGERVRGMYGIIGA